MSNLLIFIFSLMFLSIACFSFDLLTKKDETWYRAGVVFLVFMVFFTILTIISLTIK